VRSWYWKDLEKKWHSVSKIMDKKDWRHSQLVGCLHNVFLVREEIVGMEKWKRSIFRREE
jgi:hypothetical protein